MAGFRYNNSRGGLRDVSRTKLQMKASASISKGDALEFASGKLQRVSAATDIPRYIAAESATSTATSLTLVDVIDTALGLALFDVDITPLVNGTACESNSTTTTVKVALADGSSSDLVGGLVYIPELNETRIITANTYSSNVVTITVAEAFSVAPTTTHTCRLVPFGFGTVDMKLHATNFYNSISVIRAELGSGHVVIHDVDMEKKVATVCFI